jgi:hypothetical protein
MMRFFPIVDHQPTEAAKREEDPDAFLVAYVGWVMTNAAYTAYLASAKWKRIRGTVLRIHNHECACCGAEATEVHHRDYRPRVLEGKDLNALVPVCRSCHKRIEEVRKVESWEDVRKGNSWNAGEQVLARMIDAKSKRATRI